MSVFAEFDLDADGFALSETLAELPEAVVEIERVVASERLLTPYFWVSDVSAAEFEAATDGDSSIRDLCRLDEFEDAILYRAEWTENIDSVVYAYTEIGAVILDATGQRDAWEIQLRFDDRDELVRFRSYCTENDVTFQIKRLYEITHAHTGRQFGLTEKQHEALVRAWQAGFFESPAETTLTEVAEDLDISQQALSQRIRKGQNALVGNTLITESPSTE